MFGNFDIESLHLAEKTLKIGGVILQICLSIVIYLIVKKISFGILNRWINKTGDLKDKIGIDIDKRLMSIGHLLRSVVGFLLLFILIVTILSFLGINIAPLLATAGVAGLAIGFGAQKLVKDVVSGFIIIAENQYSIGDYVTIGTFTGEIIEVGIRATTIRDDSGKISILSNGDIINVTNFSRGGSKIILTDTVSSGCNIHSIIEENEKIISNINEKFSNMLTSSLEYLDTQIEEDYQISILYTADLNPKFHDLLKHDFLQEIRKRGIK